MTDGPTRGAREPSTAWRASPGLALGVRVVAYAAPVIAAYAAIRVASPALYRPTGYLGILVWIAQAAAIGAMVSHAVGRLTRRLLPLATLLRFTLIFPDRAPSRFGVALRSGTVRQMRLRARELECDGLGSTAAEAAENAIVLVNGLGRHDRLTRGHTERVRAYADLIAEEMGLSDIDRSRLAWGVLLHDVGKMTVPAEVLNKSERLTDEEWGVLRNHPAAGAAMLEPLAPWLGGWIRAAGEHHERWDGRGYPAGLEAHEISLAGRITAVADAYDVITSKRSYKDPMSAEAARQELVNCSGTQFDPAVVRAMLAASIGRSPAIGSLAWMTEIPVIRAAVAVGTSPIAGVVGTAAITTASLLGLADDSANRRAAFASELELPSNSSMVLPDDVSDDSDVAPSRPVGDPPSTSEPVTGPAVGTSDVDNTIAPTSVPPTPSRVPTTTSPTTAPVPVAGVPVTTRPMSDPDPTPTGPATPGDTAPPLIAPTSTPVIEPTVTVPSLEVPSLTVPPLSTPEITVSSISLPLATTPPLSIPSITTPTTTTPTITAPTTTTPTTTTPLIETPPIQIDDDGGDGLVGGLLDLLLGRP